MNIYRCIIIDDESYAIDGLTKFIKDLPNLKIVKTYTNPMEALMELSAGDPIDLVLMDVRMPVMTGMDLSRKLRNKIGKLVFTTAYVEHAYEAFGVEADAYLLKPYTQSKFAATIGHLFPKINEELVPVSNDDFIFVKSNNDNYKLVKVRLREIVAVESKQNYILIHTQSKKVLTHMSLTEMGRLLRPYPYFAQFQRSFIIGVDHIEYINGNALKLSSGLEVTVGEYYKKSFAAFLKNNVVKSSRT